MQNKGAILFFAIAFGIVSLYYLSFTWVTGGVEEDAKEYANKFKKQIEAITDLTEQHKFIAKKEAEYLDSMADQDVYPLIGFSYRECQEKELNLGLDLKGGMNVTLEISVIDLIRSMADNSQDSTFVGAINKAIEKQKDGQEDFITYFYEAFTDIDPNAQLSTIFGTLDLKDRIKRDTDNDEVIKIIREATAGAIDNSFNILRTRIDKFGVTQPNIQRLEGGTGRILVELPGIKDADRVRRLLQGTANLEFWETYNFAQIAQTVANANNKIRQLEEAKLNLEKTEDVATNNSSEETGTETELATTESDNTTKEDDFLNDLNTNETTENAVNKPEVKSLFTYLAPSIDRQNGQAIEGATVGFARRKDTAIINSYLNLPAIKSMFPRNIRFVWEFKAMKDSENFRLFALKAGRDGKPILSGDVISDARADFGQNNASPEVDMVMNGDGASKWAKITGQNIGNQIAIVLDGTVYSAPRVNGKIPGGRSQITGNFTVEEAKDLANVLKSGKLPAPARIIEEAFVGPSLGQEAIDSGLASFIIAFFVILLYMMFYYNRSGLIADVALILNIFFIFGVLASLGAVLTLPGIAGIVLTVGMSVDANVLIYERVREELAAGKSFRVAIADGYKNAYSAIIDANVTTFLTGFILYTFGHGPIKGFATTLMIGILTSLFAAIFITRLIFIGFMNKNKTVPFDTKLSRSFFKNNNIKFMVKRRTAYIISGSIILIGLVSLVARGLDQSVDFTGGRTFVVRFENTVVPKDISAALKETFNSAPEVKTFGEGNQVKIVTKYLIEDADPKTDSIVEAALYTGLKPIMNEGVSYQTFMDEYRQSSQKVGPTIADDIKVSAVLAILASLLVMFLYIFVRFRKWQFGLGALAALVHDVLIVLGLFSIFWGILPFSLEIDQAFIAAILTVVGYSINDTVVVFDRIREYLGMNLKKPRNEVFNDALNSTLSRTFSTSLSTLFVLLAIFLFGGEVIRGFIFALLIGVVVGTYSSLFIATPVAYDTMKAIEKKQAAGEADKKKN